MTYRLTGVPKVESLRGNWVAVPAVYSGELHRAHSTTKGGNIRVQADCLRKEVGRPTGPSSIRQGMERIQRVYFYMQKDIHSRKSLFLDLEH